MCFLKQIFFKGNTESTDWSEIVSLKQNEAWPCVVDRTLKSNYWVSGIVKSDGMVSDTCMT